MEYTYSDRKIKGFILDCINGSIRLARQNIRELKKILKLWDNDTPYINHWMREEGKESYIEALKEEEEILKRELKRREDFLIKSS